MKKRIEDFTLKELKDLCSKQKDCDSCIIKSINICSVLKQQLDVDIEFGISVKTTYYLNNLITAINSRSQEIDTVKYKVLYITGADRDKVSMFFTVRPEYKCTYVPRITFKTEYNYYKHNYDVKLVTWNGTSDTYLIVYCNKKRQ